MYNLSLENILEVRGGDDRGERRKCSFLEEGTVLTNDRVSGEQAYELQKKS